MILCPSPTELSPVHGFTVFDNNAYKAVRPDRLTRIAEAERREEIIPLASLVVLQELLARVRSRNPRERGQNRSAVRKLGVHCLIRTPGPTHINFLSPVDSQVQRLLSGERHPRDAEILDAFDDMVRVVTDADADEPLPEIADDLIAIEAGVAKVESEYIGELKLAAASAVQPNQMKRNLEYAARIARRAYDSYSIRFSPVEIVENIIDIAKITSVGFALRDAIVEEIHAKGGGHAQHGNSVWDEEVVSSTSSYTTINEKTVILVTEEKRLLVAASLADASDRVCDVAAYEKLLGLPLWTGALEG